MNTWVTERWLEFVLADSAETILRFPATVSWLPNYKQMNESARSNYAACVNGGLTVKKAVRREVRKRLSLVQAETRVA